MTGGAAGVPRGAARFDRRREHGVRRCPAAARGFGPGPPSPGEPLRDRPADHPPALLRGVPVVRGDRPARQPVGRGSPGPAPPRAAEPRTAAGRIPTHRWEIKPFRYTDHVESIGSRITMTFGVVPPAEGVDQPGEAEPVWLVDLIRRSAPPSTDFLNACAELRVRVGPGQASARATGWRDAAGSSGIPAGLTAVAQVSFEAVCQWAGLSPDFRLDQQSAAGWGHLCGPWG